MEGIHGVLPLFGKLISEGAAGVIEEVMQLQGIGHPEHSWPEKREQVLTVGQGTRCPTK